VSFDVRKGSVHALVGENGAGKTTLMRMLYGLYVPDAGTIEVDGRQVTLRTPSDGVAAGIAMVHQQSLLLTELTLAENVLLSRRGIHRVSRSRIADELRRLASETQISVDPAIQVKRLSVAGRQRAELLVALYHKAAVVILDEPTTILTPQEVTQLFDTLGRLKDSGVTMLLVTHKLREMLAISDEVTVLRHGKLVLSRETSTLSKEELTAAILGLTTADGTAEAVLGGSSDQQSIATTSEQATVLSIDGLILRGAKGASEGADVSLQIRGSEIVAITGIEGNGQRELAEAIFGLRRAGAGRIILGDVDITKAPIKRRLELGVGYVPEDRVRDGISTTLSVADNVAAGAHRSRELSRYGLRRSGAWRRMAVDVIDKYQVATPSESVAIGELSGGNAQKVVVGREVERHPKLLIVVQPTQGLDIGSTERIWNELRAIRRRGGSVLLVSTDFAEVCSLASRALVMRNGRVVGEVSGTELTEVSIGRLAIGAQQ
jgi:simple sugar transport system ATP-binding protein